MDSGKNARGNFRRSIALGMSVASISMCGVSFAAPGDINDLGTAPGTTVSIGSAINDSGVVVGVSGSYAAIYSAGAMTQLGGSGTGGFSDAGAINNAGVAVGSQHLTGFSGPGQAVRYNGATAFGLGTLGGTNSAAHAINASGEIVGDSNISSGASHAFKYVGSTMTDLATLGGTTSTATAVNASGTITGTSDTSGNAGQHAFSYSGTTMTDIGTLGGGNSAAYAINNAATIVGSATTAGNQQHAFKYSGGTMTDLGSSKGFVSLAYGVNDLGVVVGDDFKPAESGDTNEAALWMPNGTEIDLNAWLLSVNPSAAADWNLHIAYGINNSGLVVGYGDYNDGAGGLSDGRRAFVLDASSLVPEPASLSVICLTSLLVGRRRCRRVSGNMQRI